jgi:hypothetical protein
VQAEGFQRCLDYLVVTPPEQSIAFFVDSDMIGFPGLLNSVVENTKRGEVRSSSRRIQETRM